MDPQQLCAAIKQNIETVVVGKGGVIDLLLITLACGGHALIEDMPGVGKTSVVSTLAASIDCAFGRIQCTPDVLPSDIHGFTMIHPATYEERFYPGAAHCNILLADELNRTSPKTQSALLQAMQEGAVTLDGVTRPLPQPFMVCATQNPIEQSGTYPLPEAQLDRFLIRARMGYPTAEEEAEILRRNKSGFKTPLTPVCGAADVLALRDAVSAVVCAEPVMAYIVDIAARTRAHKDVSLGASPRGAVALMRAAMGRAFLSGRDYVLPDDVQALAAPTLAHRLVLNNQAAARNASAEDVISGVLREARVPLVSGR